MACNLLSFQGLQAERRDSIPLCSTMIQNLSFSHIREIMLLVDPLERYFYKTECIKCGWSVREQRYVCSSNGFHFAPFSDDDRPSAQHDITVIQNGRLTRCDSTLGFIEEDLDTIARS